MENETISNVLSILAFGLSIISIVMQVRREKASHEFDLFVEIYQDHLVRKLPEVRKKLSLDMFDMPVGIDSFIKELENIRKDSLYFSFADSDFYEKLKKTVWLLEDYLVEIEGPVSGEEWQNIEYQVDWRMAEIYKCLKTRF